MYTKHLMDWNNKTSHYYMWSLIVIKLKELKYKDFFRIKGEVLMMIPFPKRYYANYCYLCEEFFNTPKCAGCPLESCGTGSLYWRMLMCKDKEEKIKYAEEIRDCWR